MARELPEEVLQKFRIKRMKNDGEEGKVGE